MNPQEIMAIMQIVSAMNNQGKSSQQNYPAMSFLPNQQVQNYNPLLSMGNYNRQPIGYQFQQNPIMDLTQQKQQSSGFDLGSILNLISMFGKQQQQKDISQANNYLDTLQANRYLETTFPKYFRR